MGEGLQVPDNQGRGKVTFPGDSLPPSFLEELHSRTLLFAKYALGLHIDQEIYRERLLGATVALAASERILRTPTGQHMASMATNLLARLCHNVTLLLPSGIPRQVAAPLLACEDLRDGLLDLASKINPAAQVTPADTADGQFDAILSVGPLPPGCATGITVNADGWVSYLSTEGSPFAWVSDNSNPLSAYVAACLGVSEVFKRIWRQVPGTNLFRTLPSATIVFSLLDYGFAQAPFVNPPLPNDIPLGEVHFMSMGALNSAALYALCSLPGVSGLIHIIEPQRLDISNLNRYPMATASAALACEYKAVLAAELARPFFVIGHFDPVDYAAFRARAMKGSPIDLALVGVDNDLSRWAVQNDRPHVLLCGGTEVAQVTISRHDDPVRKACLGCLYPATVSQEQQTNPLPIPTTCFVSALGGMLLAAELVKSRIQSLAPYCVDLAIDMDVLAPGHAKLRKPSKSPRCGCRCWEFG